LEGRSECDCSQLNINDGDTIIDDVGVNLGGDNNDIHDATVGVGDGGATVDGERDGGEGERDGGEGERDGGNDITSGILRIFGRAR